jgi:hypothetical protein
LETAIIHANATGNRLYSRQAAALFLTKPWVQQNGIERDSLELRRLNLGAAAL